MNSPQALEVRLQTISKVVASDPDGLAVLGLGSVGLETNRLDAWSDLDFFVIVRAGTKRRFLDDPSWINRAHMLSYLFRNTADGFKLLFEDGIFCEMAIFEPQELAAIPYAPGRVIWHHTEFDPAHLHPTHMGGTKHIPTSADYVVGELLTCLYVGLCRYRRGEVLSAWRFLQSHCLDRYLELAELWEKPQPAQDDPYSRDRRFEQRFPLAASRLPRLLTGYDSLVQGALEMLAFLEENVEVNQAMKREILALADWLPHA